MGPCGYCNCRNHTEDRCYERLQEEYGKCPRCNKAGHHFRQCPHITAICNFCKHRGHIPDGCFHLQKVMANKQRGPSRPGPAMRRSQSHQSVSSPPPATPPPMEPSSQRTITMDRNGNITVTGGELNESIAVLQQIYRQMNINGNHSEEGPQSTAAASASSGATPPLTGATPRFTGARPRFIRTSPQYTEATPRHPETVPRFAGTTPAFTHAQANNTQHRPTSPPRATPGDSFSFSSPPRQTDPPILSPNLHQRTSPAPRYTRSPARALSRENYLENLGIFEEDLWPSFGEFMCPICKVKVDNFMGVMVKRCQDRICRECLRTKILYSPVKEVFCPNYSVCSEELMECEIRALLTQEERAVYDNKSSRQESADTSHLEEFVFEMDLVPNLKPIKCPVCFDEVPAMDGVVPKQCGQHYFCKDCLRGAIVNSDRARVNCPGDDCDASLNDREVQLLVTKEEYQQLHMKGLEQAGAAGGTHCMVPDCRGLWFVDQEGDGRFNCPLCNAVNCLKCKIVHENAETCADFKIKVQNDASEVKTQEYLEQRHQEGKAMLCPKCGCIVEKVDGCDGMLCTVCKTELCWATKGLRWGPGGKGDWQGGGCKCNVNGKRCAPNCQNCH